MVVNPCSNCMSLQYAIKITGVIDIILHIPILAMNIAVLVKLIEGGSEWSRELVVWIFSGIFDLCALISTIVFLYAVQQRYLERYGSCALMDVVMYGFWLTLFFLFVGVTEKSFGFWLCAAIVPATFRIYKFWVVFANKKEINKVNPQNPHQIVITREDDDGVVEILESSANWTPSSDSISSSLSENAAYPKHYQKRKTNYPPKAKHK